jgi:hypothetical protein
LQREADRVMDGAGRDFVVADESRKDGQTGSIGGSPRIWALFVTEKIPDCRGIGVPGIGLRVGAIELVQEAVGVIESQDVAIAVAGIRVTLDGICERDGHRAGITFTTVGGEIYGNIRLLQTANRIGNANGRPLVLTGAEIRMKPDRRANEIDDGAGIGVDHGGRDVLVPRAGG